MGHTLLALCLVLIVTVLGSVGAVAMYNTMSDGGMVDAMWDQMRDMGGGMMDGDGACTG